VKGITIGYRRVSSLEQNLDRQLAEVTCDKIFEEKVSGKDMERPQLSLLLEFAREGDLIVVHSLDRLARNLMDLRNIIQRLNDKGVAVKFVKEGMTFSRDEHNPMSTLMLNLLGAIAEFEREIIRERQKEGIAIAKNKGKYKGRKRKLDKEQFMNILQMLELKVPKAELCRRYKMTRPGLDNYLKGYANGTLFRDLERRPPDVNDKEGKDLPTK
jgi:DNA invertase Pin-like site-specific DNA recombinase